jgi:hypothetical protein
MDRSGLLVEYESQVWEVDPGAPFDIGRDADLTLDENRFLHRRLLRLVHEHGFWWLINIGSTTSITVFDPRTSTQAWLGPGSRLPIIFGYLTVVFTAGPCGYEIIIRNPSPLWQDGVVLPELGGDTTVGTLSLTASQRLLLVALAEPMLRQEGSGLIRIPSNQVVAKRLGWTLTRLNRKLDNVCDKFDRFGVEGLRGGVRQHAMNRRARLIEFVVSTGLVTAVDLRLLDQAIQADNEPADEGDIPTGAPTRG